MRKVFMLAGGFAHLLCTVVSSRGESQLRETVS